MDVRRSPSAALAAWRAELAASRRCPWLATLVLRHATAAARRAAAIHARLAALPRRTRRRLARRWAMALPVAALALAWSGGAVEAATIIVGDGCTLVDAIHAANGDEAVGDCAAGSGADTVVLGGGTYSYRDADNERHGANALPVVWSEITIEGNGATIERVADASQAFRLLLVEGELLAREFAPSERRPLLTLRDADLRGGYAKHDAASPLSVEGGIILAKDTGVRLERVGLRESDADWRGGAIALRYSEAELVDTVISGSFSNAGGAISAFDDSHVRMHGGAVADNHAGAYGGGVFAYYSTVELHGTRVSSNYAPDVGGGLSSRHGDVFLDGVEILDNDGEHGGGLHVTGGSLDVIGSQITGNRAAFMGGGIYAETFPVRIRDSIVRGNEAVRGGGVALLVEATIEGSVIEGNTAEEGDGGGIFAFADVTVRDTTLSGNFAWYGGAVNNEGVLTIVGGQIEGNSAAEAGGGVFNAGSLSMVSTAVRDGSASERGGGVANTGRLELVNSQVTGNRAGTGGGIQSGDPGEQVVSTLRIQESVVSGNSAHDFGGGVDASSWGSRSTIMDSEVRENYAAGNGGGLRLNGRADLRRVTIEENRAYGFGGGAYVHVGQVDMRDCTVSGNRADSGGGVYNQLYLEVHGGVFDGNHAQHGGALFNRETATVQGAIFRSNSAVVSGGAIYAAGTAELVGLTIEGNEAGEDGGGVASDSESLRLRLSRLSGNVAGSRGGAIFAYGWPPHIEASTLDRNEASRGGGVYASGGAELVDSTLSGNRAELSGAAVHATWAITLTESTLADNGAASENGGSLYQSRETALLSRSILTGADTGGDCAGAGSFRGTDNLVDDFQDGACADIADAAVTGLAPELAANGGPTLTRALLPDSNAIDAVSDCVDLDGDPLATDQRGAPRPQDGDGDGEAACDVGAYERAEMRVLSVTIEGPGRGTVHGPAFLEDGIACGEGLEDCAESYANGMDVALEARPWPGWLAEWSGDCDEDGRVVMNADRTCSLRFVADPTGGPIFLPAMIKE